ncbi:MAG: polysaccharide pyruvyl transferase family protein [Clostridia bacterium]|nr:polysaccharide pyruvyl transferase family protein [Clostridia bacterium]
MKIGIRTVFKTENCGSYLQAWALKEQLSSDGNIVYFSDHRREYDKFTKKLISVIKCCVRFKFERARGILKKRSDFKRHQRNLQVEAQGNESDIYFFGSDTLWNLESDFFAQNISFFTGADLDKPCYTYSMSIASTSREEFLKHSNVVKNIQKFKKIAVRDSHTEGVLQEFYPAESIVRTVDPTLLFDKDTYIRNFATRKISERKTLVLYYFGSLPRNIWAEVQKFARKRNLQIVYIGLHDKEYDLSVVASPENFISAFANAEYIFTNTFHGCVFSTIFNKQFATDGIHKKKIEGFLEEFSLLDRVVASAEDLEKVMETPVDYERVNALVNEKRKASVEYLEACIREVRDHE